MGFVNEFIAEADYERTGIKDIAKRFGGPIDRSWTIDRERNMYLHCVDRGREEARNHSTWIFCWHGELVVVWLALMEHRGERGEPGWSHWKLRGIDLPPHLQNRREEVLADLEEALIAYKDFGTYSVNTNYTITLDI
ncbi:MAG TPA: hypothetical protein PKV42_11365 [Thiobacillus sp.]|nr:MAG: hypothetical protein B7Y27_11745 [Hydrogenophilales bacterium 16-64-40]OZA33287.1 MAG: hypothetical protein B7X82_09820 [Hydrogenophilales bacterium 17-64-65]HQS83044.1 hypothetical protein [Thiobacillus sp.]HQT35297.1 hypothetical protein [Thiobacillus sp.]